MKRNLGWLLLVLPALASAGRAPIKIEVNLKDGATISGDLALEVSVDTEELVTKVEMFVNGEVRGSDDGTPYEFALDSIAEKEGPIQIRFVAQTAEGHQGEKKLNLVIDNGVGKGAEYWVEQGSDALVVAKWDDAIKAGRIALKAKPKFNPARLVLGRGYFGKGVYDKAQLYTEFVLADEKDNVNALDLLSAINLQRAFRASGAASDPKATLQTIKSALSDAATSRLKVYEAELAKLPTGTDEEKIKAADMAMRANRFSVAVQLMDDIYRKNSLNNAAVNRLIYAQLRSGRYSDAVETASNLTKRGKPDGEGAALAAIVFDRFGDDAVAMGLERKAIEDDASSLGVRMSQAFLAWTRGNIADYRRIVAGFVEGNDQLAEVNYYLSNSLYKQGEFEPARKRFEQAVLSEPALYDTFIQAGQQAIDAGSQTGVSAKAMEYYYGLSRVYFEAALAGKPESFEAYTGLTIISLIQKNAVDALNYGRLAVKTGPEYAAGYYAVSIALTDEEKRIRAQIETEGGLAAKARSNNLVEEVKKREANVASLKASLSSLQKEIDSAVAGYRKFDKKILGGSAIPDAMRAFGYFQRYGRAPIILIKRLGA